MHSESGEAVAARVAANVSLSYNAPQFLLLRIGLLGGHPVEATELVALEAGVQQAVGRLEAQVEDLQQELEHERTLHAQQQAGAVKAQAELEVQLAVSKASHKALQQMLETARAEVISLKQQLHDSQLTLADRQLALASECKATKDGLLQACPMLQQLSSPLLQQQQEQQQEPKQHGEASALTSSKQQASQQPDNAADTAQQQDQLQQQQHELHRQQQQLHEDHEALREQQPSPPVQHRGVLDHVPAVGQLPELLPSPAPPIRCGGQGGPLTPQRRSRIPTAPDAVGSSSLSYAAALRKSQSREAGGGPSSNTPPPSSKPPVFKFTAEGPFASSGTGSISNRRRILRPAHGQGSGKLHKQALPTQPQGAAVKVQQGTEARSQADCLADARKRRWR